MNCDICRKQLASERSFYRHIQTRKHIKLLEITDDEEMKIKQLLAKINDTSDDPDAWYDIIKKYIIDRKGTAKIFLRYFFDVLGQIINNSTDSYKKNNSIRLAHNVSKLFKRPIPDWIIITDQPSAILNN